jgi:hypothetical protein
MMDEEARREAERAMEALEAAIAHGPQAPHQEVADAVRCMIALRDHLLERARRGDDTRTALARVNSLVSLAHGAEHPLIGFHLHRLEQTRDGLAELLKPA